MGFLSTIDQQVLIEIWNKFDAFLIEEFRKANPDLPEAEILESIVDGKLTIKYQEDLRLESLPEDQRKNKITESEEYLVVNFATEDVLNAFKEWKELQ